MLLRLAWWGANIYFAKKSIDTMKENIQLKKTLNDTEATVRTLARQVPQDGMPPLPIERIQVEEIHVA